MNRLAPAYIFSLALHMLLFLTIFIPVRAVDGEPEILFVDLNLPGLGRDSGGDGNKVNNKMDGAALAAPAKKKDTAPLPKKDVAPPEPERVPESAVVDSTTVPQATPMVSSASATTSGSEAGGEGRPGLNSGSGESTGGGRGKGSESGDGGSYLRANYDYIAEHIRRQLIYPSQARRMGMSGKAEYSFTVEKRGQIIEIRLNKSCGFPVLDKAGEDAIRRASPLPPPAERVRIVIPIVFTLK